MYSKITNPKTGAQVSIKSKLGKRILRNYLNVLSGGAHLGERLSGWRLVRIIPVPRRRLYALWHNV